MSGCVAKGAVLRPASRQNGRASNGGGNGDEFWQSAMALKITRRVGAAGTQILPPSKSSPFTRPLDHRIPIFDCEFPSYDPILRKHC